MTSGIDAEDSGITLSFGSVGGDKQRLWEYVTHWHRWLHGGLQGLVTRKGGVKRYYIYILRQLGIP